MKPELNKSGTREVLLRAAEELFSEKAYAEVGIREIAERGRVNLAAIKYHFGSKGQLFVQAVLSMLSRWASFQPTFKRNTSPTTRREALNDVVDLIDSYLSAVYYVEGPQVCRIIFREILGASCEDPEIRGAVVHSVVRDFMGPDDRRLTQAISILLPQCCLEEVQLLAQSIVGQCAFYLTHRVFYERLREENFMSKEYFKSVREHIVSFSLRAMRIDETAIASVLESLKKREE